MNTCTLGWLTIPAALLLLSCGDAVPPPGEGAVGLNVQNSGDSPPNYGCPGGSHTLLWGTTAPGASSQGSTWVDGRDGHKVKCSVKGDGTFNIHGEISGNSPFFQITGTAQAGGTGIASVDFFDQSSLAMSLSDSACTVSVDSGYKVEKGAIWAAVRCSHLTSLDDMYLWCAATGTFVFKSCDD